MCIKEKAGALLAFQENDTSAAVFAVSPLTWMDIYIYIKTNLNPPRYSSQAAAVVMFALLQVRPTSLPEAANVFRKIH